MTAMALIRSPWRAARWLIIAPHPDDETLGAGALAYHAAGDQRLAGLVFVTDGSGSHPAGTTGLAAVRRREARSAAARLGASHTRLDWLGWQDGHPPAVGSIRFTRTAMRLAAIIRSRRVNALAVSDPGDRHCDHVAAFWLACEAHTRAQRRARLFTYPVWNSPLCTGTVLTTPAMPKGLRRRALSAHRSQLSPRMGADGFRLPVPMRRMAGADRLIAVDWPR